MKKYFIKCETKCVIRGDHVCCDECDMNKCDARFQGCGEPCALTADRKEEAEAGI